MITRKIIDAASLTTVACGLGWVLGYAAGRLVEGAPDAGLWVQAASSLCLLAFAGVQVWATVRRGPPTS